jgi:hypothetical protein
VTGRFCSKIFIPLHQESSSISDAQNYTVGTRMGQSACDHSSRNYPPANALAGV